MEGAESLSWPGFVCVCVCPGFVSRGLCVSRVCAPGRGVSPSQPLSPAVMLIEELQCPGRLKTLKRLKGKRLSRLQPLPRTLRLLGLLQLDENHRVGKAATACLARAGGSGSLRARVSAGTPGNGGDIGHSEDSGASRTFPGPAPLSWPCSGRDRAPKAAVLRCLCLGSFHR